MVVNAVREGGGMRKLFARGRDGEHDVANMMIVMIVVGLCLQKTVMIVFPLPAGR